MAVEAESLREEPVLNNNTDDGGAKHGEQRGSTEGSITTADETVVAAGKTTPTRSKAQTMILMLALCMAVFLAALDAVIITTALPTISREVGASDSGFAWIGAAYLLANAASVPFWGKVSDIFGRKPILVIANVVFMVGSLAGALARTLTTLVAGRAVQGLGGGGLMALVNIVLGDLFSPRERGAYFGMIGAVWGLASGIGPLIGGGLTENISWRWCFWINLPISGLSLLILVFFLKIHTPKTPLVRGLTAIDWLGTVVFTGATMMLLLGLQFGGVRDPWGSPTVVCLIVFGCLGFAVFALVERFAARYPLMPRSLFGDRSVVFCYAACFFHGLGFAAIAFFLPVYFQTVLGAGPIESGVWLLATALPLAVCTMAVGVGIRKTGRYNEIIRAAMAVTVVAFGLFTTFPARRDMVRLVLFQIVAAVGISPNLQALLIALQAIIKPGDVAAGTATFAFVRHVAIAVGVVAGQVLFQSEMGRRAGQLAASGVVTPEVAARLGEGGSIALVKALGPEERAVVAEAVAGALSKVWILFCAAAGAGLVVSFGIRGVVLSGTHEVTRTGLEAEEEKVGRGKVKEGDEEV
ncbi:hypothetical protein CPLU01_01790 [Colletotrichum plurivorum]|uniref:Major facilitator superfamily (MFS) profile domain-containing protein n=1 Tax=Colletotrichum plurivorum TaxID=2175906 RepID=A0A8H6KXZ5_9PEZI|nr:hypothetical protein CPLU01_01790 [Colletotrichum plurivorum]